MARTESLQLFIDPSSRHLLALSDPGPFRSRTVELPTPSLGSGQLVAMAARLSGRGYRVLRFELADSRFVPLEEEYEEDESRKLVSLVSEGRVVEAARLLSGRPRIYVTGFEVDGPDGILSTVRQNGALNSSINATIIHEIDEFYSSAVAS